MPNLGIYAPLHNPTFLASVCERCLHAYALEAYEDGEDIPDHLVDPRAAAKLSSGKGPKRMDGTLSYVDHGIPPHVLALAERLALIPDEKLKAVSVLLGIKL